MPLAAPISIADEANAIQAQLLLWAQGQCKNARAVVKVMANMRHMWEEIFKVTDDPKILIVYAGENSRGSFQQANTLHRVDRQWTVVIIRSHGFINNAISVDGDGGEIPFTDAVEAVRDTIRCMANITEEFPVDYKGVKLLPAPANPQMANVFLDGYTIEFSTANDIPAITRTE